MDVVVARDSDPGLSGSSSSLWLAQGREIVHGCGSSALTYLLESSCQCSAPQSGEVAAHLSALVVVTG